MSKLNYIGLDDRRETSIVLGKDNLVENNIYTGEDWVSCNVMLFNVLTSVEWTKEENKKKIIKNYYLDNSKNIFEFLSNKQYLIDSLNNMAICLFNIFDNPELTLTYHRDPEYFYETLFIKVKSSLPYREASKKLKYLFQSNPDIRNKDINKYISIDVS